MRCTGADVLRFGGSLRDCTAYATHIRPVIASVIQLELRRFDN